MDAKIAELEEEQEAYSAKVKPFLVKFFFSSLKTKSCCKHIAYAIDCPLNKVSEKLFE